MTSSARISLLGYYNETGDDFIDSYQLRASFTGHSVEHHSYISDVSKGIRNRLEIKKWRRVREIGRGGFGIVHLETEEGGTFRAVKEIPKYTHKTRTMDHLREILAMAHFSADDAFFIRLHGWFQNEDFIFIAMEYAWYGDLEECVTENLPEPEVQTIALQLAEALTIMHQKNFTHRDLKPSNVFVVARGPAWWVKLGDFGVSKRVRGNSTSMHTSIETDYSAPEILGFVGHGSENSSQYTNAVDLWSLGCLLHWLLTRCLPLTKWDLMPFCLGSMPFPGYHLSKQFVSLEGIDFIQKLMVPQPHGRMSASEALKHGWPREGFDINSILVQHLPSDAVDRPSGTPTQTLPKDDEGAAPTKLPDIAILQGLRAGEDANTTDNDGEVLETIAKDEPADVAATPISDYEEVLDKDMEMMGRPKVVMQGGLAKETASIDFGNADHASVESLANQNGLDLSQQLPTNHNQGDEVTSTDRAESHTLAALEIFRRAKPQEDKAWKLQDLRRFSRTFKLKTPVPADLVGILSKDPAKQEAFLERSYGSYEAVDRSIQSPSGVDSSLASPQNPPFAGVQRISDRDNTNDRSEARNTTQPVAVKLPTTFPPVRVVASHHPRSPKSTSISQQSVSGFPQTSWAAVAARRSKTDSITSTFTADPAVPQDQRYSPLVAHRSREGASQSTLSSNARLAAPHFSPAFSNSQDPKSNLVKSGGPKKHIIHVRNLPWSTSDEDLIELFCCTGRVNGTKILCDTNGRSRGSGIVEYNSAKDAEVAIDKLSGYLYGGRPLRISYAPDDITLLHNGDKTSSR